MDTTPATTTVVFATAAAKVRDGFAVAVASMIGTFAKIAFGIFGTIGLGNLVHPWMPARKVASELVEMEAFVDDDIDPFPGQQARVAQLLETARR